MINVSLSALVSAAVLSLYYLLSSRFGADSYNYSPDWAHHLALIQMLVDYGKPWNFAAQLGEFASFPRYAHIIAADLARHFAISPFVMLQLLANAMVILATVLSSMRMFLSVQSSHVRLGRDQASIARCGAAGGILVVSAGAVFVARALGLTFDGQVQWNFFYSQAMGTALAIGAFLSVQLLCGVGRRAALLAGLLSVPVTLVLASFHTVPAIWFGAACAVLMLSSGYGVIGALVLSAAVAALNVGAILSAPGTMETMRIMEVSEGVGGVMSGPLFDTNIAAQTGWIYGAIAAMALVLLLIAILSFRLGGFRLLVRTVCGQNAGLTALLGIAVLLVAKLTLDGAEQLYPLTKYVYFYAVDLVIALACAIFLLVDTVGRSLPRQNTDRPRQKVGRRRMNERGYPLIECGLIIAAILGLSLAQYHQVLHYALDQSAVIAIDKDLRANRSELKAFAYPQFPFLSTSENYYLAISSLEYPRYPTVTPLFEAMTRRTDIADRPSAVPPRLAPTYYDAWEGRHLAFGSPDARRTVLVLGDLDQTAAPQGLLLSGTGADLLFAMPVLFDRSLSVCLEIAAPADGSSGIVDAAVSITGRNVDASRRDAAAVGAALPRPLARTRLRAAQDRQTLAVPIAELGPDLSDIRLRIDNLDAAGQPLAAGRHGVELTRMWAGSTCAIASRAPVAEPAGAG